MKRMTTLLSLLICGVLLVACTSKSVEPTPPSQDQQAAAPKDDPSAPSSKGSATREEMLPSAAQGDPLDPSRDCTQDSDCAVKDIGNCCGYFPACVNKDAKVDPAAVKANCEKNDLAGICGFQEINACRCVAERCEAVSGAGSTAEVAESAQ